MYFYTWCCASHDDGSKRTGLMVLCTKDNVCVMKQSFAILFNLDCELEFDKEASVYILCIYPDQLPSIHIFKPQAPILQH